jgi:hypothetical protein
MSLGVPVSKMRKLCSLRLDSVVSLSQDSAHVSLSRSFRSCSQPGKRSIIGKGRRGSDYSESGLYQGTVKGDGQKPDSST